jgi:D-alanine--poly(phosphoribitol) ligase subunit 1
MKNITNLGIRFNEISKKYKNNIALNFGNNEKYTYSELSLFSEKIVHLFKKFKISKDSVIAIESEKNIITFSIIIACWKTGVIYSFFDTDDNSERINKIIKILKPSKIFTFKKRGIKNEYLLNKKKISNLKLQSLDTTFLKNKKINAYIMFTSGSTGFPKGVIISHANLAHFINWSKNTFSITQNSVLTNLNPLHFDNSVFDIYSSFLNGACLVPFKKEELYNSKKLVSKINFTKCEIWFSVPSLLNFLLEIGNTKDFSLIKIKKMIFGGERFPINSVRKILKYLKKVQVYNVSGPTECTCICSVYKVTDKEIKNSNNISIGKINSYFNYKILNNSKKNTYGELILEGPAVSAGYYNNSKDTKKNFFKSKNTYGYKTGDIVKIIKKDNLKIIGRIDNQIKFLGYRIELEEIENTIIKQYNIEECLISIKKINKFPYEKLICYITKKNIKKMNTNNLIELTKKLPYYMCPKEIIYIKKFKFNKNGKVDRNFYKSLK